MSSFLSLPRLNEIPPCVSCGSTENCNCNVDDNEDMEMVNEPEEEPFDEDVKETDKTDGDLMSIPIEQKYLTPLHDLFYATLHILVEQDYSLEDFRMAILGLVLSHPRTKKFCSNHFKMTPSYKIGRSQKYGEISETCWNNVKWREEFYKKSLQLELELTTIVNGCGSCKIDQHMKLPKTIVQKNNNNHLKTEHKLSILTQLAKSKNMGQFLNQNVLSQPQSNEQITRESTVMFTPRNKNLMSDLLKENGNVGLEAESQVLNLATAIASKKPNVKDDLKTLKAKLEDIENEKQLKDPTIIETLNKTIVELNETIKDLRKQNSTLQEQSNKILISQHSFGISRRHRHHSSSRSYSRSRSRSHDRKKRTSRRHKDRSKSPAHNDKDEKD